MNRNLKIGLKSKSTNFRWPLRLRHFLLQILLKNLLRNLRLLQILGLPS